MRKTIETEIDINASAERVWEILTDLRNYQQWNPFIRSITGVPAVGETLWVTIRPHGGREMIFKPTVIKAESGRELRWLGRLALRGIFDGEHYFRIEPLNTDKVRFVHGENFRGILVGLFSKSLDKGTEPGFRDMNQALKRRAEDNPFYQEKKERAKNVELWRKKADSCQFEEAEPLMLAATAENDDFGDNIVSKAEFYEAWGDHLSPEPSAEEKYALSHVEWAWFAACSTSGGEGTARMLDVNRVAQKIADLHK